MKKNIAAGFIVLLPLLITYTIVSFLFRIITGPLEHIVQALVKHIGLFSNGTWIFTQEKTIHFLSSLLIVTALFLFFVIVGSIGRWVFFESILYLSDKYIRKIPVINKIYGLCKAIIESLFSEKASPFKQVVIVPYPSTNQVSIGLVTAEFTHVSGEVFVSALVPGVPNPTVGFLCSFPKKSVTFIDLSVDDAIKYLMSCGASVPKNFESAEKR